MDERGSVTQSTDNESLLDGVRVLDLSQGIAGPYCGAMLQQQGAAVVKLEPPAGDWARAMGTVHDGCSAVTLTYNAGKRGLCVDASQPAGRDAIRRIAAQVDVVLQNFRVGVVERLGIGHADLSAVNPRLVYVSVSGFGPTGPQALQAATDTVLQAAAGLLAINRGPSGAPQRNGLLLADIATALYATQLTVAALFRRAIDGRGRHLQISMLEACAALQTCHIADAVFSAGRPPAKAASAPSGVFETADGWLTLSTLNNAMFERLCAALQRPSWIADARYGSNSARLAHAQALNDDVAECLHAHPTAHWLAAFGPADVLHSPVHDHQQFLAHPQVLHQGLFGEVRNPGQVAVPRARLPGTGRADGRVETAPAIGEHSVAVLRGYGFAEAEIATLLATRAVVQAAEPEAG